MAQYHLSMKVIGRSSGRSSVAAAAYRAGESLRDERAGRVFDYSRRSGVERSEILLPAAAPAWCQGITREALWNRVEAGEKRKDAQTAREVEVMIPRELDAPGRVAVVREYVQLAFVSKGMIADISWHNKTASDGLDHPHAHVLLTMRTLTSDGFGPKCRHDLVPDPSGRLHADGRPVMVASNAESWNSQAFLMQCRRDWQEHGNAALARSGSQARIDCRSLLERGLSRLPQPALRLAYYLKDLYGCMRERFGQFQMAKHYQAVEQAAKDAYRRVDPLARGPAEAAGKMQRFYDWFERQLDRLETAPATHSHDHNSIERER